MIRAPHLESSGYADECSQARLILMLTNERDDEFVKLNPNECCQARLILMLTNKRDDESVQVNPQAPSHFFCHPSSFPHRYTPYSPHAVAQALSSASSWSHTSLSDESESDSGLEGSVTPSVFSRYSSIGSTGVLSPSGQEPGVIVEVASSNRLAGQTAPSPEHHTGPLRGLIVGLMVLCALVGFLATNSRRSASAARRARTDSLDVEDRLLGAREHEG